MTRAIAPYKTAEDLHAAIDEFLLGDVHAKNHLAGNILASMRSLHLFAPVNVLQSQTGNGHVIDIGNGCLEGLRPLDGHRRN